MKTVSLEALKRGQSLLVGFKPTSKPGKIQIEIAEKVGQPTVAAAFNQSDPNFRATKARRAWQTITVEDGKALWPQFAEQIEKAESLKAGEMVEINWLNPKHPEYGQLHILVTERTVGEMVDAYENATSQSARDSIAYQLENLPDRAKKAGADGKYLTCGGEPIISSTTVEFGDQVQSHRFLPSDPVRLDSVEGINLGLSLVDAETSEEKEEVEV